MSVVAIKGKYSNSLQAHTQGGLTSEKIFDDVLSTDLCIVWACTYFKNQSNRDGIIKASSEAVAVPRTRKCNRRRMNPSLAYLRSVDYITPIVTGT